MTKKNVGMVKNGMLIGERKKKMFSKFFKTQQFQGKKRRDFIHIEKSKFCCLVAK